MIMSSGELEDYIDDCAEGVCVYNVYGVDRSRIGLARRRPCKIQRIVTSFTRTKSFAI